LNASQILGSLLSSLLLDALAIMYYGP